MTRTMIALIVGAVLAPAAACLNMVVLGEVPYAKPEPLAAVCTDPDLHHHQSCEVGYLAMYIPHGPTGNCETLYAREVTLHPQDDLLQPDFLAGCEAAGRELNTLVEGHVIPPG